MASGIGASDWEWSGCDCSFAFISSSNLGSSFFRVSGLAGGSSWMGISNLESLAFENPFSDCFIKTTFERKHQSAVACDFACMRDRHSDRDFLPLQIR